MHYKDSTPAALGDIIQHDSGIVGILIGGTLGNDYCSSHAVWFKPPGHPHYPSSGAGFVGALKDDKGALLKTG